MWRCLSRESPPRGADLASLAQKLVLDSGRSSVSKYVQNSFHRGHLGYWSQMQIAGLPGSVNPFRWGGPRTLYFSPPPPPDDSDAWLSLRPISLRGGPLNRLSNNLGLPLCAAYRVYTA